MKKLVPLVLIALTVFTACRKETAEQVTNNTPSPVNVTENTPLSGYSGVSMPNAGSSWGEPEIAKEVNLLAGQNINVGKVTVTNDINFVYVTYTITNPAYRIKEVHMYIGDPADLPLNNSGSPTPGHFPNKITFKKITVTSYTFAFPTADIDNCFSVAAHAVVTGNGTETAWGEGTSFDNQWGMYFSTCKAPLIGQPG